jgi:hypothetical protein
MFFGFTTFTLIHVLLSLIALVAGVVVVIGLIGARRSEHWTALYLITAVLTNATGFGFASAHILPSHILGALSLVVLLLAILGFYVFRLAGAWRWIYAVGAVMALFFDVFVAIAQAFAKIPSLHVLAPTQSEPPFLIAELINLAIFVVLVILAARKFHPGR